MKISAEVEGALSAAEKNDTKIYHPAHNSQTGGALPTIFLGQMAYWWHKMGRKPFYKFVEPCGHKLYKPGESWTEELGIGKTALVGYFQKFGRKLKAHEQENWREILAGDENLFFVYWTNRSDNLTHWTFSEAAYLKMRLKAYELSSDANLDRPDADLDRPDAAELSSQPDLPNIIDYTESTTETTQREGETPSLPLPNLSDNISGNHERTGNLKRGRDIKGEGNNAHPIKAKGYDKLKGKSFADIYAMFARGNAYNPALAARLDEIQPNYPHVELDEVSGFFQYIDSVPGWILNMHEVMREWSEYFDPPNKSFMDFPYDKIKEACELEDLADKAIKYGQKNKAEVYRREAVEHASRAANWFKGWPNHTEGLEPTRSQVFLAAANIVYRNGYESEAKRLALEGLEGNPPDNIAKELGYFK